MEDVESTGICRRKGNPAGIRYFTTHSMFQAIKDDLRELKGGEPGSRFRDFYDFRRRHRRQGFSPARFLTIFFGLVLVIGGASIGWLPGPGGFVAIFGLALLAQEFRPLAALLDWVEPKLHTVWKSIVRFWRRMSAARRVALALVIVLTSVSVGYAAYTLLLR